MTAARKKQPDRLFTTGEAAKSVGIHPRTIQQWVSRGLISPAQIVGSGGKTPQFLWAQSGIDRLAELKIERGATSGKRGRPRKRAEDFGKPDDSEPDERGDPSAVRG